MRLPCGPEVLARPAALPLPPCGGPAAVLVVALPVHVAIPIEVAVEALA